MKRRLTSMMCVAVLAAGTWAGADEAVRNPTTAPAVKDFKPLSENVNKALAWVAQHQLDSGGWGQGEESNSMGGAGKLKDTPSVGDTSMALMALMRAGNTPEKGPYAKNVAAGVKFVCGQIEEADADSLLVTKIQGTRIQSKLGQYVDTFMAATMLADVQEKTTDKALLDRVTKAMEKVLKKIQKNQRADGKWGDQGWASTLQQGAAAKALDRAGAAGNKVDAGVVENARVEAAGRFDAKSGKFAGGGSAGVDLYATSSSLAGQQAAANANAPVKDALEKELSEKPAAPRVAEIQTKLASIRESDKTLDETRKAVVAKMEDHKFISGFGSNGGEEFLSHMNIGESLVVAGGEPWKKWDESMTTNMNQIQNADGSWSGHHCITGRTFCTSAALLVLMVDRTPVPLSAKLKQGK
ncbi:MAG: prenyltransferase/squalene oxidase repeat-containing protein [Planctomycetota bacterium]